MLAWNWIMCLGHPKFWWDFRSAVLRRETPVLTTLFHLGSKSNLKTTWNTKTAVQYTHSTQQAPTEQIYLRISGRCAYLAQLFKLVHNLVALYTQFHCTTPLWCCGIDVHYWVSLAWLTLAHKRHYYLSWSAQVNINVHINFDIL